MPRTKSADRAARASERKRIRNQSRRSQVKSRLRRAETMIAEAPASAAEAVKMAIRSLDKAVAQGVIQRNSAARRKSRLMKKLNAALAEATPAPSTEEKPANS